MQCLENIEAGQTKVKTMLLIASLSLSPHKHSPNSLELKSSNSGDK